DSNIGTNNSSGNNQVEDNAEESFEYEVGKTEIQTISTPGEVRRITASVAIDGDITGVVKEDVQKIVKNSIGMNDERGDSVAVVSMEFDPDGKAKLEEELSSMKEAQAKAKLGKAVSIWAVVVISLIVLYLAYRYISNKKTNEILKEIGKNPNNPNNENALTEELENKAKTPTKKRRNYILGESDEMTLEEEVKLYASEKPDQVTEIIKTWLNE
ncbi:MAG: flagellar M-ring protein FliF C-terminal domain-containing protein, partial [Paraclostridium sp.]